MADEVNKPFVSESTSSINYLAPFLFFIFHISVFITELIAFNIWTFPFNSQMKPSKFATLNLCKIQ